MRVIIRNIALLAFMLQGVLSTSYPEKTKIELVKQPTNVNIETGQSTVLNCEFNKPVFCIWLRNEDVKNITGRYEYVYNQDIEKKKVNCSIKITNATQCDNGQWICTFRMTSSEEKKIESMPAFVNVAETAKEERSIELVRQPTSVILEAGQSTELNCEFNKLVDCSWKRNGTEISISKRYTYIYDIKGKKNNCSIKITNANEEDQGLWICTFKKSTSQENPNLSMIFVVNIAEKDISKGHLNFLKMESAWISMAFFVSILLIVTLSNTILLVITCYRSSKSKSCPTGHCMVTEKPGSIKRFEDNQVMAVNEVYESTSNFINDH